MQGINIQCFKEALYIDCLHQNIIQNSCTYYESNYSFRDVTNFYGVLAHKIVLGICSLEQSYSKGGPSKGGLVQREAGPKGGQTKGGLSKWGPAKGGGTQISQNNSLFAQKLDFSPENVHSIAILIRCAVNSSSVVY